MPLLANGVRLPRTPNPAQNDALTSTGKRGRPILFQVVDPTNRPIWSFLLALHMNPRSFNERFSKSDNVVMTYGGFVEFIWPEELDTISAESSTGGFLGPLTGLASGSDGSGGQNGGVDSRIGASGRHGTMAWERQEDLLDLFRHNGIVYNGYGLPVIRGRVMCIYDRGIYIGHFTNFSPKEDDSHAYSFELSWEFKVEDTIYKFPGSQNIISAQAVSDSSIDQRSAPSPGGATSEDVANFLRTTGNGQPVPIDPAVVNVLRQQPPNPVDPNRQPGPRR